MGGGRMMGRQQGFGPGSEGFSTLPEFPWQGPNFQNNFGPAPDLYPLPNQGGCDTCDQNSSCEGNCESKPNNPAQIAPPVDQPLNNPSPQGYGPGRGMGQGRRQGAGQGMGAGRGMRRNANPPATEAPQQ